MNNKTKTLLGIAALVILIVIAYIAYDNLSSKVNPEDTSSLNNQGGNSASTSATESTSQGNSESNSEPSDSTDGVKAVDFTVVDNDGNKVKLSDLYGKPLIVNMWASWCSPCRDEMPHFNKLYEEYKDEINFMMVDLIDGQRETVAKGKKFIEQEGFKFPVFFDTEEEAAYTYMIRSIPTTFFIDSDGYIKRAFQGGMSEEKLRGYIKEIYNK